MSIFTAIVYKDLRTFRRLLENDKTLVNSRDEYGFTPLHQAILYDNFKACELLIKKGASVHDRTENGDTPLHLACIHRRDIMCGRLLLENGALVNITNEYGRTPLHEAASQNDIEYCRILLENGALVNEKTNYQQTPFHLAVNEYFDCCQLLLENGALVNERDLDGDTPLHYLCGYDFVNVGIYRQLMDNGCAITKNNNGEYPDSPYVKKVLIFTLLVHKEMIPKDLIRRLSIYI